MLSPFLRLFCAVALVGSIVPALASAAEGMLEIGQVCATSANGCFPGDTGGFPVTITPSAPAAGYVLTSDLVVPNEDTGAILISRNGVRVDLNGFTVLGPNECSGTPTTCTLTGSGKGVAVSVLASITGAEVFGGSVVGMGGTGVDLGPNAIARDLRVLQNGLRGIGLNRDGLVMNCTSHRNRTDGIITGDASTVSDSVASRNGDDGIAIGVGSSVTSSAALRNGDAGIEGSTAASVREVAAFGNGGDGINAGTGSTVSDCSVYLNGDDGISVLSGSSVRACAATGNVGDGISTSTGGIVLRNSVHNNGTAQLRLGDDSAFAENVLNAPISNPSFVLINGSGTFVDLGSNYCTATLGGPSEFLCQ